MTQTEILTAVRKQLAVDLNCSPDDFDRDGIVFCETRDDPGRRPFPRGERHFDMLTMGNSVVVSATPDILPYIKERLDGKTRDEAFHLPFICGHGICFLPNDPHPLPLPDGFDFVFVERSKISELYALEGFHYAISNQTNAARPDVLVMTAKKDGIIVGMSGASMDCEMLWQIGINVLPEYRNLGLAAALTNRLAIEILQRGKIPYYGVAVSNIASQRVAQRAGFRPAWSCVWRGVFDGLLTEPTS